MHVGICFLVLSKKENLRKIIKLKGYWLMKNILVLVQDYPNNSGGVALMYVHVRNKYYIQHDINVTVLNFSASDDYIIDNIKVITEDTYKKENIKYDVVVSHAANIKNHYRFLKKYDNRFEHMIFFFHGHEVVMVNEVYPKPYDYMKKDNWIRIQAQNCYDRFKLLLWHKYYKKIAYKSEFVFVSNSLHNEFQKYVKLSDDDLKGHVHVINNSVGKVFEENSYNYESNKKYDFITIRNNMDSSTYCIDLICRFAEKNPELKFLIIGKGKIFEHIHKPNNVTWINKFMQHNEILKCVDSAKCALMLTRRDTQGVMSCELITYGIPLITSDLPVCREIFEKVPYVTFVNNEIENENFSQIYTDVLKEKRAKIQMFGYKNTVEKEENLIKMEY